MKRAIVALLVGGLVFGTVLAIAASLSVNAGALQSGTDSDLKCDGDGVIVTWVDTDSDPTNVEDVTVAGINGGCVGASLTATANPGGETCTVASIASSAETCTLGSAASTATTTGVTVQIIGGGSTP